MSYLNLESGEIVAGSNIDGLLDHFIEVDEVIAPVICELNRKGYKTRACCSGHPFDYLDEAFVGSEFMASLFAGFISCEKSNDSDYKGMYRVLHATPASDFYIFFDKCYINDFPVPIPEGFEWDKHDMNKPNNGDTFRFNFTKEDPYEFLEERLTASKALYNWAKELPEKKTI